MKAFSCPVSNTTTYTLFSPPFFQISISSSAIEEMALLLLKANLFSFGCAGSSLPKGYSLLWRVGAVVHCSAWASHCSVWASHCSGFCCCQ